MTKSCGIDFFPFSVDFFDDDKIALIEAEFGHKGVYVAIRLLCKMYKTDGYFYQWGRDECLLFSKKLGADFSSSLVEEIVNGLLRRGFFCKSVFKSFGVLTSRGMQARYFEAVRRRQVIYVRKELLLVNVENMSNVKVLDEEVTIDALPVGDESTNRSSVPLSVSAHEAEVEAESAIDNRSVKRRRSTVPEISEEEERLKIIAFFTFRNNFYQPEVQYERMRNWNNTGGRSWDAMNHAQRISAATMWKQKTEKGEVETRHRHTPEFLIVWEKVYDKCVELGADLQTRAEFLSEDILFRSDMYPKGQPMADHWAGLTCSKRVCDFICVNYRQHLKTLFEPILEDKELKFYTPKK